MCVRAAPINLQRHLAPVIPLMLCLAFMPLLRLSFHFSACFALGTTCNSLELGATCTASHKLHRLSHCPELVPPSTWCQLYFLALVLPPTVVLSRVVPLVLPCTRCLLHSLTLASMLVPACTALRLASATLYYLLLQPCAQPPHHNPQSKLASTALYCPLLLPAAASPHAGRGPSGFVCVAVGSVVCVASSYEAGGLCDLPMCHLSMCHLFMCHHLSMCHHPMCHLSMCHLSMCDLS